MKAISWLFCFEAVLFFVFLALFLLIPAKGIAGFHVQVAFALLVSIPILIITGLLYWYLRRRISNEEKNG